jgi:type III restriction enzyme
LIWNSEVPEEARGLIEGLPSFAKPAAAPRPIKRILKAAQALAQDGLVPDANKAAHDAMFAVIDNIVHSNGEALAATAQEVLTAEVRRIIAERGAEVSTDATLQRPADAATVDDALRHLRREISASVVNRFLTRNMESAIAAAVENGENPSDVDITAIRASVAALGLVELPEGAPRVQAAVEDAADALTRLWLTTKAGEIAALPDSRQPTYDEIRDMAREPELVALEIKTDEQVDTVDTDRNPLETARKHVLSDADGNYPLDVKLNRWERAAIQREAALDDTVGWYRNPSAAGKNSLRIPFKDGESWKSVQPDLIFVTRNQQGTLRPSIVDPHGAHLGDSLSKLKALAFYTDNHGDEFDRIVAVGIEKDGFLYGINLEDSSARRAVYESAADAESVKALYHKHGSKYAELPAAD